VPLNDPVNIGGIARHIRGPHTEPAVTIDGPHPLAEKLALGLLFLIILSLHFKHEHFAVHKPNQIVRTELANDASE
jgi:hypothetical protein